MFALASALLFDNLVGYFLDFYGVPLTVQGHLRTDHTFTKNFLHARSENHTFTKNFLLARSENHTFTKNSLHARSERKSPKLC